MPTEPLTIETTQHAAGVRLAVAGELDLATVGRLEAELKRHQGTGQSVILDLSQLEFIDSTGLRLLIDAQADARRDGWSLSFAAEVTPAVRRLLDLTSARPLLDWRDS